MRLTEAEHRDIMNAIAARDPAADVYLFGSRADDSALGGDIDLLDEGAGNERRQIAFAARRNCKPEQRRELSALLPRPHARPAGREFSILASPGVAQRGGRTAVAAQRH